MTSDPMFNTLVTDYCDPALSSVIDMASYIGRPRMNIDLNEKGDHYCVCVGEYVICAAV